MSFLWLAAWLIRRRPKVEMFRKWNDWGIALAVSLAIDLLSGMGRSAAGGRAAWKRRAKQTTLPVQPAPTPEKVPV